MLHNINNLIINKKSTFSTLPCAFLKNHNLDFLGFMLNIHELQYEDSVLRPVLDRDNMIKSSA